MSTESHKAAMVAPIRKKWPLNCAGACLTGERNCTSPMECSGATKEADQAIAQFRTRRVDLPIQYAGAEPQDDFHPLIAATCWGLKPLAIVLCIVGAGVFFYYR